MCRNRQRRRALLTAEVKRDGSNIHQTSTREIDWCDFVLSNLRKHCRSTASILRAPTSVMDQHFELCSKIGNTVQCEGKGEGLDTCYRAEPLTWVRLVTSSALQSRKWQLIGMSQWCRSALCGHPLPVPTDNWTHGAASRHTIAPISHTRPSPRSRSYYSFSVPVSVGGWVGLSTQ